MKKNCLFQYALAQSFNGVKIIEDTDLITRKKAEELWDKYYPDVVEKLENGYEPQMAIWINCKTNTDYNETDANKNIDYRDDLFVKNGIIYIREIRSIK